MAEHIYTGSLEIALPRHEVFSFFANAENLERITPPQLGFQIITPTPIEMKAGALIDYRISLHGIPMTWRTEITKWDPPHEFVDKQLKGPYKQWIHRHTFTETENGTTLIGDEVRYRLPFEPFGDIARFFVEREIKNIFDYRQKTVAEVFKK
ncbi:MAG: SRPBCC family protein [Pyrinomonadaceae bacterium]